jgi:general secretion pathway protein I
MTVNRPRMTVDRTAAIVAAAGGFALCGLAQVRSIVGQRRRKLRDPISEARREAGFTLVEVIVALAMLSIGLGVLLSAISNSLQRTTTAEQTSMASSLAQSLLEDVGVNVAVTPGEREGLEAGDLHWRLTIVPYGDDRQREKSPIGLYRVVTEIDWQQGPERRWYRLETLRLGAHLEQK